MPRRSFLSATIDRCRAFGGQVAISVAASAVAAAFLAMPDALVWSDGAQAQGSPAGWVSPIASDGKIAVRHRGADADVDYAGSRPALLTPSTIAMPMTVAWPRAAFDEPQPGDAPASVAKTSPVVAAAPARRTPTPPERPRPQIETASLHSSQSRGRSQDVVAPATAQLAPAQQASAPAEPSPSPLARVGGAVSSAVGTVGAAGLWTLSQASGLLPRF
jgi:hypothetical protein